MWKIIKLSKSIALATTATFTTIYANKIYASVEIPGIPITKNEKIAKGNIQ